VREIAVGDPVKLLDASSSGHNRAVIGLDKKYLITLQVAIESVSFQEIINKT
jgi:hypothetical protein